MYDRKKITLFVLLIATVILGGVSLYLATQINQDQAPDDSQAGSTVGVCTPIYQAASVGCVGLTKFGCETLFIPVHPGTCCEFRNLSDGNSVCVSRSDAPIYCNETDIDCAAYTGSSANCTSTFNFRQVRACHWSEIPTTPTNANCTIQGVTINHGREACVGGRVYECNNGSTTNIGPCTSTASTCSVPFNTTTKLELGAATCDPTTGQVYRCVTIGTVAEAKPECCSSHTWNGSTCIPASTPGGNCIVQGTTIFNGAANCVAGRVYRCTNGVSTNVGACSPTGGTTGEGSQGEDSQDEGSKDEGTKDEGTKDEVPPADTCTPTAPTPAQLVFPLKNAVVNTSTVNLQWQKNGTFGVNCPTNSNKYRVRIKAVGINEACPTSSLDLFNAEGDILPGDVSESGIFSYSVNVFDNVKYCWAIRKNNGGLVTDTGVRTFTVDLAAVNPSPGVVADDGAGVTVTAATAGEDGNTAGEYDGSLPATALVSDELDPILLGMVLVIIGLTLYKFNIGKKKELE